MDDFGNLYSEPHGSEGCMGRTSRSSSPAWAAEHLGFTSSIRSTSISPQADIQIAAKQVQACIESTSLQLRNDYKHRQAVYQSWCPPPTGLRSSPQTGSRQPYLSGSSLASSPSISSMWAAGERMGGLLHNQQLDLGAGSSSQACLASGSSFADFFAARKSAAAAGSGDGGAVAVGSSSSMPILQALAQDVRATAAGGSASRPMSPLMMKCLLGSRVTTPLLLERLRQQAAAAQQQEGQQGLFHASNSPPRSLYGSSGTQGSMGELSLWAEPLNVSPVSPHRAAAAAGGSAAGTPGRAGGSLLGATPQERPPSPTVLSLLGTEHNIAPAVVAAAGEGCGSGVTGPYNAAPNVQQAACCRSRSCSPTAFRAAGPAGAGGSRSRSCSPHQQHLICCGCRRQHSIEHHSKCCHLCGNCCQSRGGCQRRGASAAAAPAASAAVHQGSISSEASGASASTTSTCPCVRAYKKGCSDTMQHPSTAGAAVRPAGIAAAAAGTPRPSQAASSRDRTEAGLGGSRAGEGAAAARGSSAGTAVSAHSRQPSAAHSAAGSLHEAAAAAAATDEPEDLVRTAFLEVHAAQQNLISQGPAADTRDVEELTTILQQVLPAAEPQHEALLKEVLARQQQLLAMQETFLAEQEAYGEGAWQQVVPPLRLPSQLGGQQRSSAGGAAQYAGGDSMSTRTVSNNSTTSSATQRAGVCAAPDSLSGLMTQEDRLAAAAAAYEAFEAGGHKPLQQVQQAAKGTAGSRSSRGRWTSAASTLDTAMGQPVHADAAAGGGSQHHGGGYMQQVDSGFEGAAPAYAADSLSGSEAGLDEHSRPLIHYMSSQGGGGSRHVVQDAGVGQVQESRSAALSRAASSSRAPQPAAECNATGAGTNRTPSNRSIADSAWSVQAPLPGAAAHGSQQQVHCSMAVHAARAPEQHWAGQGAAAANAPAAAATAGGSGAAAFAGQAVSQGSQAPAAVMVASAGLVPALNLGGGALDTETAKLAGLAVDPRVLPGLSPRLREGVEAAGCLQELAAAMSWEGSIGTRLGQSPGEGEGQGPAGGPGPAPVTPGRPGVLPGERGTGGSAVSGMALSHSRSSSVRFQEPSCSSAGGQQGPAYKGAPSVQQQQLWHVRQSHQDAACFGTQQQHPQQSPQQCRTSVPRRAGSFELPDSNPSTHENSCQSFDGVHTEAGYPSNTQLAAPKHQSVAHADKAAAAAGSRSIGCQQSLAQAQQGAAVQQAVQQQEQGLTGRAAALQQQQQQQQQQLLRHNSSNLSSHSSPLDAVARARVLTPGGGGSRHSAAGPLSPFSSRMHSPRNSLAAAAAAAAAAVSGSVGSRSRPASETQSPWFVSPPTPRAPPTTEAAAAGAPAGQASTASGLPQQPQHQQVTVAGAPAASLSRHASSTWRERQLLMQQELAAQQQQLERIRSRGSSAATTPAAAAMLRSVSRSSGFSIASSTAAAAARAAPGLDAQQQQQTTPSTQGGTRQQLPSRQQGQQLRQPLPASHARSPSLCMEPSSASEQSAPAVREEASAPLHALDAILCDALKQRCNARLMKQALLGWRQHAAGRKAKAAHRRGAGGDSSRDSPVRHSQQQAGAGRHSPQPSSRPASSQALRISLQGLNSSVLKQSLGQLLQGRLDDAAAAADTDSLEIVVSGQLRLQSPTRQRSPSPHARERQHAASNSSSGSRDSPGSGTIRRFEEQLLATREAVAAAAERAGRAPLQGVLRDMQSMITRMEAVCSSGEGEAGACSPQGQRTQGRSSGQSPHHQSPVKQHHRSPCAGPVSRGCSPGGSPGQRLTYAAGRRPASAGGCDWQGGQAYHAAGAEQLRCSSAFARARSPHRQGPKVKSPDRHKLRGRLHLIQDRLAKVEMKMHQASAMSEPCSCNAAGCVHRLNGVLQGRGEQEGSPAGGACCCSLQGKRDVLVGRMQQELEDLQIELMQLGTVLPGAYSTGC